MSDRVRVVVVCEDIEHRGFITRLLKRLGHDALRVERMGGTDKVLSQMKDELREMRRSRMSAQPNLSLLVVIDADGKREPDGGLAARVRELEREVAASDTGGPRRGDERIVFLVPALEIENWYVHLCAPSARPVDEGRDYKDVPIWKDLSKDLAGTAKGAVEVWCKGPAREDPSSIVAARKELSRLD